MNSINKLKLLISREVLGWTDEPCLNKTGKKYKMIPLFILSKRWIKVLAPYLRKVDTDSAR